MRYHPVRKEASSQLSKGVYLAILILIVCSVALAILPSAFNYVLIKLAIAQFLLIILFIIWLYHTLDKGEILIYKDPAYLPLALLSAWGIINLLFSSFRYAGVNELEKLLTCVFLYFAFVNLTNKEKDFLSVVISIIIVFAGLSIQGLFDYLQHKNSVIISTFGNPNFFSAYLILILPLVILVGIYNFLRKNFLISSLIFIVTIITTFLVYILSSQGAWLGLGCSLLFLIILFRKQIFNPKWRVPILAGLFALLLIGTILSVQKLPQIRTYIEKDMATGTLGIRIKIWQGTLRMIKARPFMGWGMGTYQIVYPRFRIPEYFLNPASVNATDHAHNELLEVTSEMGIIGLGIFLWLLGVVFFRGIKVFYRRPLDLSNIIHAGLLAGVVALLIHNLTCVNLRLEASALYLYLFLGLISVGCKFSEAGEEQNFFEKKFPDKKTLAWLIIPIAILLGFVYTHETISLMRASVHLKEGIILREKKKWEEAIEEYQKAIYWDHYTLKAYYRLAYAYAETKKIDEALATYLQLKEIAPDYADIHYNLGSLYLRTGKWENAREELQRAIELNPYEPKTHCNLGAVYMQLGEVDNAITEYQHSISAQNEKKRINPKLADFVGGYIGLGDIYYSQKQWEEASENYKMAVQLDKENAKILVKLGNSYFNMQDFRNAKKIYEEALHTDSSLTQVKELIDKLNEVMQLGEHGSE